MADVKDGTSATIAVFLRCFLYLVSGKLALRHNPTGLPMVRGKAKVKRTQLVFEPAIGYYNSRTQLVLEPAIGYYNSIAQAVCQT